MPAYMPCRTGQDDEAHLYLVDDPDHSLCGKSVEEIEAAPGERAVCLDCARRLLVRTFRSAAARGVITVEVSDQA